MQVEEWIKAEAHGLGFPYVGITTLEPPPHLSTYQAWVAEGRHAGMAYLSTSAGLEKRADPRRVFPSAKSLISLVMPYAPAVEIPHPQDLPYGRMAAYAWGSDYHEIIPARLATLARRISDHLGVALQQRGYTDTGPILERDLAQRAGLGWAGKNTCLILPRLGTYFFLAELLVDIELAPDLPFQDDRCGSCQRCIEACPTGCIREDRTLDAERCISYLTIENKGPIPMELRSRIGNWVFGCDACQLACPWNRFATDHPIDPAFQPRPENLALDLLAETQLDARAFNLKFKTSPVRRAKRRGYLRNVCIALGNAHHPASIPALVRLLQNEAETLIRGAAAWALGQIESPPARAALEKARRQENDPQVLMEISTALETS